MIRQIMSFRPRTYFGPLPLEVHLKSSIKGADRRALVTHAIGSGQLAHIPTELLQPSLSEEDREAAGSNHPAQMGGEYLPDRQSMEVEIARITIDSTTRDVTSVYARRIEGGIAYRVVDEYEGDTLTGDTEMQSELPLTLAELGIFFLGAWNLIAVVRDNFEDDDDEGAMSFFSVESAFYPHLESLIRGRVLDSFPSNWG